MTVVKFELPQLNCIVTFHVKHGGCEQEHKKYFVIAGGRSPEKSWLQDAVKLNYCPIHCADKGAEYALEAGIVPDTVYGDADSAAAGIYDKVRMLGANVNTYNPAKDDTDLQLLLNNLPAGDLLISGIWGGRFDHLYSNVFSLLGYKKRHVAAASQVIMADEQEVMLLLNAGESAELQLKTGYKAKALSLLPLSDAVVDLSGVRWPLQNASLRQLYPYAVSNEVQGSVHCHCSEGCVGLYLYFA